MEAVYDIAVNECSVMICIGGKKRTQLSEKPITANNCVDYSWREKAVNFFLICAKISYSTDVLRDR